MATPSHPPGDQPGNPPAPGPPTLSFYTLREPSAQNQFSNQNQVQIPNQAQNQPHHRSHSQSHFPTHRRGFSQGHGYSHGRRPHNLPQISLSFSTEVNYSVDTRLSSNPAPSASTPTRSGPGVAPDVGPGLGVGYGPEGEYGYRNAYAPGPGPAGGFYTSPAIPAGGSTYQPDANPFPIAVPNPNFHGRSWSGSGPGMGPMNIGIGRERGFTPSRNIPGTGPLNTSMGRGLGFTAPHHAPRLGPRSDVGMGRGGFTPTPPRASFGSNPNFNSNFGSAPGVNSGPGSGPVSLPSRFFNQPPASYARVRGTGPPPPLAQPRMQLQGPRSFTAQTVSATRPANVPSFIAQASSPLGEGSPSTSRPTPAHLATPQHLATPTITIAGTPTRSPAFVAPRGEEGTPTPNKEKAVGVPTLTVAEATLMLTMAASTPPVPAESLPTLSISVALYSPMGSFLPPLQPLILTSNTHLRGLILTLQDQLLANLRHSGSLAKLLVQSIEVRVFDLDNVEGLARLPRIEGLLSGEEGGLGEEVGKMVVGKSRWVAWDATGGQGEVEKFWNLLVRKLLLDEMKRVDREAGKAPMLKVRTVVKIGEIVEGEEVMGERIVGGGHLFRVPAGARLPSPALVAQTIITPRVSIAAQGGKEPDNQMVQEATSKAEVERSGSPERSIASASGSGSPSSSTRTQKRATKHKHAKSKSHKKQQQSVDDMAPSAPTSDDKIEAAEKLLQSLGLSSAAKQIADELKKIQSKIKIEPATATATATAEDDDRKKNEKVHYERMMSVGEPKQFWVEKGGYPKDAPVDPENNWEKYQTWGEKPTDPGYADRKVLHDMFPLRHIPFNGPPCTPWNKKKDGEESDDEEDEKKGDESIKMVPYAALDPELVKDEMLEDRNKPEKLPTHVKEHWDEQERIKGMSGSDDETFFPASNPAVIKKEDAAKVFAAKEYKNPARPKFDIRSVLSGPTERRASSNSAYLNSLIADGPSNFYEQMPAPGGFQLGPSTTFNHSHAAADNTFQSNLQNVSSFSAFAKQNYKPASPSPGFYELSRGVTTHTPVKEADSFISNMNGPESQDSVAVNQRYPVPGTSFGEFNSMASDYAGHQTAGTFEDFNAMAAGHDQGSGYNMIGGNIMGDGTMSGSMMGNTMMGGRSNLVPSSLDSFGSMAAGGPSDFRGIVSHGIHQPAGFPNQQGWTSMNTAGATYNTFGGQSSSFNPRTAANTAHNRAMGSFPQFGQSGLLTPNPLGGRVHSRFFNPTDSGRATPGNERFAFNNMAVPSNPSHPAAGSFVNPMANPGNPNHPAAGSFVHGGGSSRSRTHGLHIGSKPPASSRVRRPIPIMTPGSTLAASAPAFQLPSPTRLAINYGAGPTAPLGSGTPANAPAAVRRTPSPEKKAIQKAPMDIFSAAIASAFNGPKSSPSGGSNA
ncbi:hypothetical protein BKA65DRAFT_46684 [Rhexocercosporidium sp. MPI-PUGE-AT-0058]|nr:hypothetical protein BKA65DRAFT_46684 [Rhexocercosporidium sp. MPI-PUGE-AT-0058]